jgi:hypothetical protein
MEKLNLEDLQEESSSPLPGDLPEDDVYSPTKGEEASFVDDILGTQAQIPPQERYAGKPERAEWPEHTYETKGGKKIVVRHNEWGSMWSILFVPGGQMPAELQGHFTNDSNAIHAVEQYLAKQDA